MSATEFAMVVPVFMIVIAICADIARMSMLRNLANTACYEANRFAMVEGAKVSDGKEHAQNIIGRVGRLHLDSSTGIVIKGVNEDGEETNEIEFDSTGVRTRIEIPMRENALFVPGFLYGNRTISAQSTIQTERYRGFYDATTVYGNSN